MFSKKPDSTVRQPGSPMAADATFSVLGPDIAITGDLSAKADLHLDGKVGGDISCAALVQGETSEITGAVVAQNARVAGRIRGSITADVLVIQRTARIEGDVSYGALTIEEGAQVDGKFTPRATEPEPKLSLAGGFEAN
jgi:cytoskeletal protein CcmA (bactofilin family)